MLQFPSRGPKTQPAFKSCRARSVTSALHALVAIEEARVSNCRGMVHCNKACWSFKRTDRGVESVVTHTPGEFRYRRVLSVQLRSLACLHRDTRGNYLPSSCNLADKDHTNCLPVCAAANRADGPPDKVK